MLLVISIMVPGIVTGVVSTFSSGGLLALVAYALTLPFLQRRRVIAAAALVVVALGLGLFMAAQEGYWERVQTIQTVSGSDDTSRPPAARQAGW